MTQSLKRLRRSNVHEKSSSHSNTRILLASDELGMNCWLKKQRPWNKLILAFSSSSPLKFSYASCNTFNPCESRPYLLLCSSSNKTLFFISPLPPNSLHPRYLPWFMKLTPETFQLETRRVTQYCIDLFRFRLSANNCDYSSNAIRLFGEPWEIHFLWRNKNVYWKRVTVESFRSWWSLYVFLCNFVAIFFLITYFMYASINLNQISYFFKVTSFMFFFGSNKWNQFRNREFKF